MSAPQTFWQLLDDCSIEIPIIQRDYAQGRTDKKVQQIRSSFVGALYKMMTDENQHQVLDFVYGTINGGKLVLLDGQQRLTTLFLLHCYIAAGTGNAGPAEEKLLRFSYKTRASSRDFCEALVKNARGLDLEKRDADQELSESIQDASWFYSVWMSDPTIRSMLVMLDELHRVFGEKLSTEPELWEKLIRLDRPPITFYFLDMVDFDLTDELYIKMNARGRPLSEFENVKAWLQGYAVSQNISVPDGFWERMDKEWTDIFWSYCSSKNVYEIDESYLRFFKSVALATFASTLRIESDNLDKARAELVVRLKDGQYISPNEYESESEGCFSGETLRNIDKYLQYYGTHKSESERSVEIEIFEAILSQDAGYLEQVRFYALFLYISRCETNCKWDPDRELQLERWLRVALNLINNTSLDSPQDYVSAVHALDGLINLLVDPSADVYQKISQIQVEDIKYFNKRQRKEEIRKAQLILKDKEWESLLEKCEAHEYFFGQIGFLIDFSKDDLSLFRSYSEKAASLFSDKLIKNDDYLLQRALLAMGDYLIVVKRNKCFCRSDKGNARDRDENWRKVFNGGSSKYIQELLDKLEPGEEEKGLKDIIENANTGDWRQYFIRYPNAIRYCKKRQIRYADDGRKVYLLAKERMSGRHAELRTYVLHQRLIKESCNDELASRAGVMENYYSVSGKSESPGIQLQSRKNQEGELKIEFSGKFKVTTMDGSEYDCEEDANLYILKTEMDEVVSMGEPVNGGLCVANS
jgi:hypothetical protein